MVSARWMALLLLLIALFCSFRSWSPASPQPGSRHRHRRELQQQQQQQPVTSIVVVNSPGTPAPPTNASGCLFPELLPQWFLVVTSNVTQTAPGVSAEAAADAAAAEILQSLSASGTQFANLDNSDTHLAAWSGPLPAQGSSGGGGGGNASSFQVTVAQALLGQPSADQTSAMTRDVALGQASALANGSHSDVLGADWPVLASAATAAAGGGAVGTGQRVGTASTKEVLYTSCLPASFGASLPLVAHTHAAFVSALPGPSPDAAACAAAGGYPSSGYWLVGTLTATALPLNATNNGGASQAVAEAWGTPYAEAMERSDFLDTLALTMLSALADEGAAHTSLQLLSWEASAGNDTVEYAFARPLTQQLAPSVVASIPLPYTFDVFESGAVIQPLDSNDTIVGMGELLQLNETQCLPAIFGELVSYDSIGAALAAAPAAPPPPAAAAGNSSGGSGGGGGGSSVSAAAIAVPVAVGVAALGALAGWVVVRRRRRRRRADEGLEDDSSMSGKSSREALEYAAALASHNEFSIPYSELQLKKALGSGSYGSVWLGQWRETAVAIKFFLAQEGSDAWTPPGLGSSGGSGEGAGDAGGAATAAGAGGRASLSFGAKRRVVNALKKEASIMASLRHPHTVLYLGMCVDPPALVMEHCARGSLLEVLLATGGEQDRLDWTRRLGLAFGAAKGMLYLHSCSPPILHRDLKSANLLVDRNWQAKVADFNLSRAVAEQTSAAAATTTAGGAGNPRWLAPEMLCGGTATPASDVYSFGLVLWELLALQLPWRSADLWLVVGEVVAGRRPPIPPLEDLPGCACYDQYTRLVQRCWAQEPAARPEFEEVCSELREMMTAQAQAAKKAGKLEGVLSQGKGSTSRRALEPLVQEKENAG